MKRIRLVQVGLAAGLVFGIELTTTPARASCQTPCAVQLCAGAALVALDEMPSIVTATYDAALPGVVTVEAVLRPGSGPALQPGDQLPATEPVQGSHLLVYASTPTAWFPIDGDGFVRCAYFASNQLPAPGHGATPQTIAALAGTATCTDQLSRAGYPIPPCNDTIAESGCRIGAARSQSHPELAGPLVIALGVAVATLAGARSRRRTAKNP